MDGIEVMLVRIGLQEKDLQGAGEVGIAFAG